MMMATFVTTRNTNTRKNGLVNLSNMMSSNCQACTLVGGMADAPTCTSVISCIPTTPPAPSTTAPPPVPASPALPAPAPINKYALWLSNNTLPIGNLDNANNGSTLRKTLADGLRSVCPDTGPSCDSRRPFILPDVPMVIKDRLEWINVSFVVQDSSYSSPQVRDNMIATIVSTWEQATHRNCSEIEYWYQADEETGCEQSPYVRRGVPKALAERACVHDACVPVTKCHYKLNVCRAPDHISKSYPF